MRYALVRFLDFDIGVRLDVPPVAFTSLKWSREYQLGDWDFYPLAKLFAETKDGFGAATGTTFDHWSGRRLLRSSTYAKWLHDGDQTEWSQSFVYARARELIVPDRYGSYPRANDIGKGWGVRALASGEDTNAVDYYEAGIFYARPTSNRWLFWSVEPIVRWDRSTTGSRSGYPHRLQRTVLGSGAASHKITRRVRRSRHLPALPSPPAGRRAVRADAVRVPVRGVFPSSSTRSAVQTLA